MITITIQKEDKLSKSGWELNFFLDGQQKQILPNQELISFEVSDDEHLLVMLAKNKNLGENFFSYDEVIINLSHCIEYTYRIYNHNNDYIYIRQVESQSQGSETTFNQQKVLEYPDEDKQGNQSPILITIHSANQTQNKFRKEYFSKKIIEYSNAIKNCCEDLDIHNRIRHKIITKKDFIDDKRNRLLLVEEDLLEELTRTENWLGVIACHKTYNLERDSIPDGIQSYLDRTQWIGPGLILWYSLPESLRIETHKEILLMNPNWSGEFDRIINLLIKKYHLEINKGNFSDLSLSRESIFIDSKPYLHSIMNEINQDVFNNIGSIYVNITQENGAEGIGNQYNYLKVYNLINEIKEHIQRFPANNIILLLSDSPSYNYFGIIDNGKYELRIIAKRQKFKRWNIEIEQIVESLRTAILWWQNEGNYSEEEVEALNEAFNMKENEKTTRELLRLEYPDEYQEFPDE